MTNISEFGINASDCRLCWQSIRTQNSCEYLRGVGRNMLINSRPRISEGLPRPGGLCSLGGGGLGSRGVGQSGQEGRLRGGPCHRG